MTTPVKLLSSPLNHENTVLFTIGRMNPPTTGHLKLIEKMINIALEKDLTQINIILSATLDSDKNPLSCDTKRNLLLSKDVRTDAANSMIEQLKIRMKGEKATAGEKANAGEKIENIKINIVCMNDELNPEYGKHPILKSINSIFYDSYGYPRPDMTMVLIIGQDRLNSYGFINKFLHEQPEFIKCVDLNDEHLLQIFTYFFNTIKK